MARLVCSVMLLVFVLFCFLRRSGALEMPGGCGKSGIPVVRNLSEQKYDSYGLPGLSHKTVAGAVHHGIKEGYGTLYLSQRHDSDIPGKPQGLPIYPNATFAIPVNAVHQVWNTMEGKDLQIIITISRPPMKFELQQCKEPEAEDELMANIAEMLDTSIEDIIISDDIR